MGHNIIFFLIYGLNKYLRISYLLSSSGPDPAIGFQWANPCATPHSCRLFVFCNDPIAELSVIFGLILSFLAPEEPQSVRYLILGFVYTENSALHPAVVQHIAAKMSELTLPSLFSHCEYLSNCTGGAATIRGQLPKKSNYGQGLRNFNSRDLLL